MSKESLNINVDPLKEGSDNIEFTVDKLGLQILKELFQQMLIILLENNKVI